MRCFHKGLAEQGRLILNTGSNVSWTGGPGQNKKKKESWAPRLSASPSWLQLPCGHLSHTPATATSSPWWTAPSNHEPKETLPFRKVALVGYFIRVRKITNTIYTCRTGLVKPILCNYVQFLHLFICVLGVGDGVKGRLVGVGSRLSPVGPRDWT